MNEQFLETLKKSNTYLYIACTGAGAGLQQIIWSEPGISNVYIGSIFPYNKHETDAFLGFTPDKYVSEETALNMAIESFIRAKVVAYKEGKWDQKCIGLGLTASVASEKVHRGEHHAFLCCVSDNGATAVYKKFEKKEGKEARKADGLFVDGFAINEISLHVNKHEWVDPEYKCLINAFWFHPVFTINRRLETSNNNIKFPGNFNPPHAGHFDMASRSSKALSGGKIDYLINVDNPHKPHVSIIECLCRVAMFRASEEFATSCNSVQFTKGQPLFVDKVRNYPTCKFIVGADTLQRILDPKWGIRTKEVLKQIPKWSLLFFNRKEGTKTIDITDMHCDEVLIKLYDILGTSLPISSSQIREERQLRKIQKEDLWPVP